MKTFSDSNTVKEQERLKNATFITRVEYWRQYEGQIKSVNDTAKQIVLSGYGTSFISADNYIFIPLHDYNVIYKVGSVSYSAGSDETTITLQTSETLVSAMVGMEVSRRYVVSYGDRERLMDDGMSPISFNTEGEALNEFLADDVSFLFDNGDGFFSNKEKSGIFDSDDVFWVRVFMGYKNSSDRILFFGGLIDEESLIPDRSAKSFECTAYGHLKELERYPGYLINDDSGAFVKINGLYIKGFDACTNSSEGVKQIKFEPFSSSHLRNITVKQISQDIPAGLKQIKFRYPHHFKFDNGAWIKIASTDDLDDDGNAKLYAKGGIGDNKYVLVNFGTKTQLNEFATQDEEILLQIIGGIIHTIGKSGKPILQFDQGEEISLKPYFQRLLIYDDSAGTYADEADNLSTPGEDEVTILEAADDALIILSTERFWGVQFLIHTFFNSAALDVRFSVGGNHWSDAMTAGVNGLSETTNGFTQNGDIAWNSAPGWRENTITISDEVEYRGFMIRIKADSFSGTCKVDEIRRIIRCRGKDNDFLNLYLNLKALSQEPEDDTVIITNTGGAWQALTWKQNISIGNIVDHTLSLAHYAADNVDADSLKLSSATPGLNVFGRPPKYSYEKTPRCLFYSDDCLYVGIQNELWRVKDNGPFEFLAEFITTGPDLIKYQEIVRINKSGDVLYCLLRGRYDIYSYEKTEVLFSLGTYNLLTGSVSINSSTRTTCEVFFREGLQYGGTGAGDVRSVGQVSNTGGTGVTYQDSGENFILPFQQIITLRNFPAATADAPGLISFPGLLNKDSHTWIYFFHETYISCPNFDCGGPYYNGKMGSFGLINWYGTGDDKTKPMGLRFSFGQQGVILWDETNQMYSAFYNSDDADSKWILSPLSGSAGFTGCVVFKMNQLPSCGIIGGGSVFLGQTSWRDTAQDVSYSYLSKFIQGGKAKDLTKAFKKEAGSGYTDYTTDLNAGTASLVFDEVDDMVYLAFDKKFMSVFIDTYSNNLSGETLAAEYWNGSSWTTLTFNDASNVFAVDGHITWALPDDWVKDDLDAINGISEDSVDRWWVRLRLSALTSGSAIIRGIYNAWPVLWDSETDNGGAYDTASPLWLCYNPDENTLHGCLFDRDETSATGFEYLYFVYDLTNEALYVTQTGGNFTFNPTLTIKDFVYNSFDKKVYAVVEDVRYREQPAYLISAAFSSGAITLTKETEIVSGEWGSACPLALRESDGALYGLTKEKSNYLWQYGKEFYPRILLADFEDMTFREIMTEAAKAVNQVFTVLSDRKALFYERDSYNGEKTLFEYAHIVDIKPIKRWQHIYDGVEVAWTDPFTGASGTEKSGTFGWRRKILSIESPFIQNRFIAEALAEKYFDYFGTYRDEAEAEVTALIQLEERDRPRLVANNENYNIDRDIWWITHSIEFDPDLLLIKIKGVS